MEHQAYTNVTGRQPNHARFDRQRVVIRFREGMALDDHADIEA